ncbi:MAG: phosphohistidine phosphatase SixA [Cyanophyceae cyanobacterium]
MKLYLIRHGIAAERADYAADQDRPLTQTGRQKTQAVAERLYRCGVRFELILSSPLVRAWQTAVIFQTAGLCDHVDEFPALAPEGQLQDWLQWWSEQPNPDPIALVGHQPDLGYWTETLVWGAVQGSLVVKKAGVIGLNVPSQDPVGHSELFLLTSPKWLLELP